MAGGPRIYESSIHAGKRYEIGKKLGAGGVAKVFFCHEIDVSGNPVGSEMVFKEYHHKSGDSNLQRVHESIRSNIVKLIQTPLTDSHGNYIRHFVRPLDIIKLDEEGNFGYVMEKVDTSRYLSLGGFRKQNPDIMIVCKFCQSLADFFTYIHGKGYCYKDINEGNIYIDSKTGDYYIIDCDNINVKGVKTILGTNGYIAPEVYQTETPTRESDYFSLAAYYMRLLVGGFPMDGPGVEDYILKHNTDYQTAAPIIYGTNAVFGFHPTDRSNSVEKSKEELYLAQTKNWNALPTTIRNAFLQTFVTALPADKTTQRFRDDEWSKLFADTADNHLIKCPSCQRHNYDHFTVCRFCGKKLPKPKPNKQTMPSPAVKQHQPTAVTPTPAAQSPAVKTFLVCDYIAMIQGQKKTDRITLPLNQNITGKQLNPEFADTPYFMFRYRSDQNVYTVYNTSGFAWNGERNGKRAVIPNYADVVIHTGLILYIDPNRFIMKIVGKQDIR